MHTYIWGAQLYMYTQTYIFKNLLRQRVNKMLQLSFDQHSVASHDLSIVFKQIKKTKIDCDVICLSWDLLVHNSYFYPMIISHYTWTQVFPNKNMMIRKINDSCHNVFPLIKTNHYRYISYFQQAPKYLI